MGRLRRAAVAAMACTTAAFHARQHQQGVKRHLYAPKGSGYVEKDEDCFRQIQGLARSIRARRDVRRDLRARDRARQRAARGLEVSVHVSA